LLLPGSHLLSDTSRAIIGFQIFSLSFSFVLLSLLLLLLLLLLLPSLLRPRGLVHQSVLNDGVVVGGNDGSSWNSHFVLSLACSILFLTEELK
jgi:hypothetical protein